MVPCISSAIIYNAFERAYKNQSKCLELNVQREKGNN